jgi:hypothetical protein
MNRPRPGEASARGVRQAAQAVLLGAGDGPPATHQPTRRGRADAAADRRVKGRSVLRLRAWLATAELPDPPLRTMPGRRRQVGGWPRRMARCPVPLLPSRRPTGAIATRPRSSATPSGCTTASHPRCADLVDLTLPYLPVGTRQPGRPSSADAGPSTIPPVMARSSRAASSAGHTSIKRAGRCDDARWPRLASYPERLAVRRSNQCNIVVEDWTTWSAAGQAGSVKR